VLWPIAFRGQRSLSEHTGDRRRVCLSASSPRSRGRMSGDGGL